MKARFIGDPNDNGSGPEQITCFDHEFVKGKWRNVSSAKFATHSHFEFDGNGDGEPDLDVDAMKATLTLAGVKYHHKAGAAKLAELVAGLKKEAGE